jgi:subtilase family serine protease
MFFFLILTVGTRSATFGHMIRRGRLKFERWQFWAGLGAAMFCCFAASAQTAPRQILHGHVPAAVLRLTPNGRLPATTNLSLTIGLPLRNEAALNELLHQLYDPGSTNFHKFITPTEFAARFGPTEPEYQAVVNFAETNGLAVAGASGNRMVLDVTGDVTNIQRAFQITLRTFRHPTEPRDFYAPDTEPSVPADLRVADVWGLSDISPPRPLLRPASGPQGKPLSGSGPVGYYAGNDFRNAYVPGTTLNGAGQSVGLLEFSDYYPTDITSYENTIGLTKNVPLKNVVIGGVRAPSKANNDEVALDIEMAIAMAPGLSQVIVYESRSSASASSILSRMASDNLAKQLSSSWTWSGGPSTTIDNLFKQMAAQGQSYFQSSGDSDAYTGSQPLDAASQVNSPVGSTNITAVGGTTLTMNGPGTSWASETVWNWNNSGHQNVGSGGGVSTYYNIPWWQTNIDMTANLGSTTMRNVPDVALTADNVFVDYHNGNNATSGGFGGTSCAAPLWAGFTALVNQQAVASGGTTVGFLNPALYAIGAGTNYAACFHDITTGNNIGSGTPGLFYAVPGYDLCTGWGTPNGTNLINALAAPVFPYFTSQPSSQTVTNGAGVTFSANVGGQPPFSFYWRLNGTNLLDGGNVSGSASNVLSITAATISNAGNYTLVVTNVYGSATSIVATLTVGLISTSLALNSSDNPAGYRDNLNFTAAVTPSGAGGTVQFLTNGFAFDAETLVAGQATSTGLAFLPRGTNIVTAIYSGDANDFPATNTLAQIVTNHPPVAADAFYCRLAGYPLHIAVADLATNWSDADGDAVSLAGIGVSTNGVTLANNAGKLVYFDTNNVDDQFVCTISDGWGGTNFQTVYIDIVLTNTVPTIIGVGNGSNGSVTLSLGGAPGDTYVLEATTNLISPSAWQPLATNTLGTNGLWQFTDPRVMDFPQRFYRLKLAQ